MSNLDEQPVEIECQAEEPGQLGVEVLTARDVPLGGLRAMHVLRTLPQRSRSLIGAWCFVDHFGPQDVSAGGMDVAPHPHTGLQTVTWLFEGEVEHRDTLGSHAIVRPGEVNLMTSGRGIAHSEVSLLTTPMLRGLQLWLALPDAHRFGPRDFQHYAPPSVNLGEASMRVFLGSLAGHSSPVPRFTPVLGAEIVLEPRGSIELPVQRDHEHGVLVDIGEVTLNGTALARTELGYVPAGRSVLEVTNTTGEPARVVLLGGEPFAEQIVMWWNFIGRDHDEIVAFREAWESESDQFGTVVGYSGTPSRIPAPVLPNVRIKPRGNP